MLLTFNDENHDDIIVLLEEATLFQQNEGFPRLEFWVLKAAPRWTVFKFLCVPMETHLQLFCAHILIAYQFIGISTCFILIKQNN